MIWDVLMIPGYLEAPNNEYEWGEIANKFESKWSFSTFFGAIDGKHVVMQAPCRSGSFYSNNKKSHSFVLMAVVNADYEFKMIGIGDSGRQSEEGVFAARKLGFAVDNNLLNLPNPRILEGTNK